jgi:hypothetical protein
MPDGTFKKIYQAKNITDPSPIGIVTVPNKFIAENNWFFESLLSPALKVSIDVSKYVPQQESKIFVKRMILNLDSAEKLDYFNTSIKKFTVSSKLYVDDPLKNPWFLFLLDDMNL